MGAAAIEGIVGAGERAAGHGILPQVVEVVLAIVTPDEDREHGFPAGDATAQPVAEEADDALRDVGERLESNT